MRRVEKLGIDMAYALREQAMYALEDEAFGL